jgi:DNA-binding transcriptional ArsR family regulator
MPASPSISEVAALLGERSRGDMLLALMSGRALTAKELAYIARVTPQTTSGHLKKLVEFGILTSTAQGRFRYFRLASASVGQMLESMLTVAASSRKTPSFRDRTLRTARLCYDHLAGVLGVAITDSLVRQEYIVIRDDGGEVTEAGQIFLARLGVDVAKARQRRRMFCRPCLDWSERRFHVAGAIGAALTQCCFRMRWIERIEESRALVITPAGLDGLFNNFGIARDRILSPGNP